MKKISVKNTKLEEQLLVKLLLNQVIFKKLYLVKMSQFLTARLQFLVQDIKVSSEYVDFYTKESLILDTRVRISATQLTLLGRIPRPVDSKDCNGPCDFEGSHEVTRMSHI